MQKSRYTDSQIMAIIKQNEQGVAVNELCREHGIVRLSFTNGVLNLAAWTFL
jgi:putative transposase